jgi:hypothetical protein
MYCSTGKLRTLRETLSNPHSTSLFQVLFCSDFPTILHGLIVITSTGVYIVHLN